MRSQTLALASLSCALLMLAVSPAPPAAPPVPAAEKDAATAPADEKAKETKRHTVAKTDLVLSLNRDGRIDSAKRIKVRLLPDAYSGGFEIAEVLKTGGRVKKGDVLMRFDSEPMDKALDDARVDVDHATRRLQIARSEQLVMKEGNATRIEQAEKARVKAEKDLEVWEKFDGPDTIKQAELGLKSREFGLADEKQELSQLEEMYSGTHLAQETKDIVLDRAKRGVMMGEEWMKLAKNDDIIAHQYRHPLQDQQVRDALRWSKEDEAHAKVGVSNAEDRKAMEIESAERGLKDAQEKLTDLEADRALLELVAPADGIMTTVELDPRDSVSARQTICEVLEPSVLVVKFSAQPEDLRVLSPAQGEGVKQVTLRLPDFPEVKLTGTITEMAEMVSSGGAGGGDANTIPVTVRIDGAASPFVRLGLKCKVHAERTLNDVLAVPKEAVKMEGAEAKVKVVDGDEVKERTVVVGPSNEKMTVVVEGLEAGDEVVVEEKK